MATETLRRPAGKTPAQCHVKIFSITTHLVEFEILNEKNRCGGVHRSSVHGFKPKVGQLVELWEGRKFYLTAGHTDREEMVL